MAATDLQTGKCEMEIAKNIIIRNFLTHSSIPIIYFTIEIRVSF